VSWPEGSLERQRRFTSFGNRAGARRGLWDQPVPASWPSVRA
jgi:hypothetical protein